MVIERQITGFGAWDGGGGRKPLSRGALFTIAGVAALHLGGALYLYTMRMAPPAISDPGPERIIDAPLIRLTPDKPPEVKTAPNVVRLHKPLDPPPSTTPTITYPPQPDAKPSKTDNPPELSPTVVKADPGPDTAKPADKVIRNPTWLARPSADQLAQFYPARALDDGVSGQAVLDCFVTAGGQLTRCTVSSETPKGRGFGDAALKASRIFRMSPRTEDGAPVEGGTVHIPIHFQTAG